MQRRSFGRRINAWLDEPDGEQFTDGKWRFWLPAVLGFSILNAVLTVLIFRETASANYLTPALLAASAIVGWIAIGCLHYSDAKRGRMARGVSALDSASLLFVIAHFCFLVYILGHSWILRGAEAEYKAALKEYNTNAQAFHAGNEKIADALREAEAARKETAKIEQDTAYQLRQAARHGATIKTERSGGITANIELAKVELPPPPKAPEDSQAAFLTRWDALVRVTNFGELILAAVTLIFIRNWTARTNQPARPVVVEDPEDFPLELDAEERPRSPRARLEIERHSVVQKADDTDAHRKTTQTISAGGLTTLRDTLKLIAFQHPPMHFKVDVKPDCVWIRSMTSDHGIQRTAQACRAHLEILSDAVTMEREAFRKRLENFLRENDFEI